MSDLDRDKLSDDAELQRALLRALAAIEGTVESFDGEVTDVDGAPDDIPMA